MSEEVQKAFFGLSTPTSTSKSTRAQPLAQVLTEIPAASELEMPSLSPQMPSLRPQRQIHANKRRKSIDPTDEVIFVSEMNILFNLMHYINVFLHKSMPELQKRRGLSDEFEEIAIINESIRKQQQFQPRQVNI